MHYSGLFIETETKRLYAYIDIVIGIEIYIHTHTQDPGLANEGGRLETQKSRWCKLQSKSWQAGDPGRANA